MRDLIYSNSLKNGKSTVDLMAEVTNEAFINSLDLLLKQSPHLTIFEALAIMRAVSDGQSGKCSLIDFNAWFVDRSFSKYYIASVSRAERAFTIPVSKYIRQNNLSSRPLDILTRYLGYVWIDATATSAIVSSLYLKNLRRYDEDVVDPSVSRLNFLYPLSVSMFGTILKSILVSGAIVAIPFMIIAAIFSVLANTTGFVKVANAIMEPIGNVLGIIATVPMSNLNPLRIFKTMFIDPYITVSMIKEINSDINERQKSLTSRRRPSPLLLRQSSFNLHEIHKEDVQLIATFDIQDGLRTDAIINATTVLGNGYIIKNKLSPWDPSNFIHKNLVLEIYDQNGKIIQATMHAKISRSNILTLLFTNSATAEEQVRISLGFAKIILEVARSVQSDTEIKLDISSCMNVTQRLIVQNIPGLNTEAVVPIIKFIDTREEEYIRQEASASARFDALTMV